VHDDPSVADDDVVHRRVKKIPNHFEAQDWYTGDARLHPAALQLDPDGMSVQMERLLQPRCAVGHDKLCNWEMYGIASFPASAPRQQGGGVVESPDPTDPVLGQAHASVRPKIENDRTQWKTIRKQIIKSAIWSPNLPIDLTQFAELAKVTE
jgi:hypothetical protein